MTDIAYHPTHVRALRETFKSLRASEFPWTADTTYLNNASTGPIPERTRRALAEFTAKRAPPHLLPDRELFAGLAAARLGVAQLINADPSEIALATNTSWGLNLAARALPLKPGDIVLVSDKEFPANVYPWLMLRDQGITVEMTRCNAQGWPDEEHLLERLRDPRVRVLAVSFVQFSNGYRADLKKLSAACRANGTYLVVDGIQGVGNSVLDVRETPIDILSCGGQKWLLSPWGSGFVYVRQELIAALAPSVVSWMAFEGTDEISDRHPVVRRAEMAAVAVGLRIRLRPQGADRCPCPVGRQLDGLRGDRRLLAPHRVQSHVPRRRPPLRNDHAAVSGLRRHDHIPRHAARRRGARHRGGDARRAGADREVGAREQRPHHVAGRERSSLRDSLHRAAQAGRGVPRPEARARGVQPARRRDSVVAALLQHDGGDGKGHRSSR